MCATVAVDLEETHAPDKDIVFCAGFGLVWRELVGLAGGPVEMAEAPSLLERMNRAASLDAALDPASYVAAAGFVRDGITERLRKEVARKFGDDAAIDGIPSPVDPNAFVVYVHLRKNLQFARPFSRHDSALRFRTTPVRAFGLFAGNGDVDPGAIEQVVVHDYTSPHDFVVELLTRAHEDRLLLARTTPGATLGDTVSGALARVRAPSLWRRLVGRSTLRPDEVLVVPIVEFRLLRVLDELLHRPLMNPRLSGNWLEDARETVQLRLDECGARLVSEALVLGRKGRRGTARSFVFNGPFLLLLSRNDARVPYLVAWVETAELLQPLCDGCGSSNRPSR